MQSVVSSDPVKWVSAKRLSSAGTCASRARRPGFAMLNTMSALRRSAVEQAARRPPLKRFETPAAGSPAHRKTVSRLSYSPDRPGLRRRFGVLEVIDHADSHGPRGTCRTDFPWGNHFAFVHKVTKHIACRHFVTQNEAFFNMLNCDFFEPLGYARFHVVLLLRYICFVSKKRWLRCVCNERDVQASALQGEDFTAGRDWKRGRKRCGGKRGRVKSEMHKSAAISV